MGGTAANVSYVTLNIDGTNRDVVVPSGLTLEKLLQSEHVSSDLIPFTTDGNVLPGALVVGREIRNGTLVLMQPSSFSHNPSLRSITEKEDNIRASFSFATSWVGIIVGIILSLLVYFTPVLQSTTHSLVAASVMLILALAYALRPALGKPVTELLAAVSCATAAGLLSTASNPEDARYQALISAFAATGMVSALRWLIRGSSSAPTARISSDTALIGLIGAVVGTVSFLTNLDISIILACLFGVSAPLLQALPGFSVNVPIAHLLDEASIVREASSVRGPQALHASLITSPEARQLVTTGNARQRLWAIFLALSALIPFPTLIFYAQENGGWEAKVTVAAIISVCLAMLLIPRTAADLYIRLIPRVCVAIMIGLTCISLSKDFHMFYIGISSMLALIFLGASFFLLRRKSPLGFTRLADIIQSLCCTFSLPLALIGAHIITFIRTGGLP